MAAERIWSTSLKAAPTIRGRILATLAGAAIVLCCSVSTIWTEPLGDPIVARIAGVDIRESDLAVAADFDVWRPPRRERNIIWLAEIILVGKSAEARKLARTEAFKHRLAIARKKLLMDLLKSQARASISDVEMRQVFDNYVAQRRQEGEVQARHILVETEEDAKGLINELRNGADFAELAKLKSKDKVSAGEGGWLGPFTKNSNHGLSKFVLALTAGQTSSPVWSERGWHVIKVEELTLRYDQFEYSIQSSIFDETWSEFIMPLRERAQIIRVLQRPPGRPSVDPVVARAAGIDIRDKDLTTIFELLGDKAPFDMPLEQRRSFLISYAVDLTLLSQSAVGKRLADTEAFERRFAIARGRLLNEEVLEINKRALVTKAAMRKYYNDNWHDERTEMSFRHILVETEAEAKAIIAKLKKGANFVDLAETNSKDLETADKGGFLGYFVMDEYPIRELEQTMSKLKVGQVSDPVKSSEGWHVVTADKKLVKPKSKFEDKNVQDEIRYYLSDQVEREWSDKLRRQVEAAITYLNSGKSD